MKSPQESNLKEELIKKLSLELTLHNQLIPSNFEDFQADWTFTVEEILTLIAKHQQALATQILDRVDKEVIGEDEHKYEKMLHGRLVCVLCIEEDYCSHEQRNEWRAEQRSALQKIREEI